MNFSALNALTKHSLTFSELRLTQSIWLKCKHDSENIVAVELCRSDATSEIKLDASELIRLKIRVNVPLIRFDKDAGKYITGRVVFVDVYPRRK